MNIEIYEVQKAAKITYVDTNHHVVAKAEGNRNKMETNPNEHPRLRE